MKVDRADFLLLANPRYQSLPSVRPFSSISLSLWVCPNRRPEGFSYSTQDNNIAHGSLLCYGYASANALVVKWISHRSPEPEVRVRSPARVLSTPLSGQAEKQDTCPTERPRLLRSSVSLGESRNSPNRSSRTPAIICPDLRSNTFPSAFTTTSAPTWKPEWASIDAPYSASSILSQSTHEDWTQTRHKA